MSISFNMQNNTVFSSIQVPRDQFQMFPKTKFRGMYYSFNSVVERWDVLRQTPVSGNRDMVTESETLL